jgi:hypothetical protein
MRSTGLHFASESTPPRQLTVTPFHNKNGCPSGLRRFGQCVLFAPRRAPYRVRPETVDTPFHSGWKARFGYCSEFPKDMTPGV